MIIRDVAPSELTPDFFVDFDNTTACPRTWVRENGAWVLSDTPCFRAWSAEKRRWVPAYLREQLARGGAVLGAFEGERLAGFLSLDGKRAESAPDAVNLTMFFVSAASRGGGVGRRLFEEACRRAKGIKARKIYISAVPAAGTIAFYLKMGCIDADPVVSEYEDAPDDRALEYML